MVTGQCLANASQCENAAQNCTNNLTWMNKKEQTENTQRGDVVAPVEQDVRHNQDDMQVEVPDG